MPKTVDLCRTDVSWAHKSDCREGILSDSVYSRSFLDNLVNNSKEYNKIQFVPWSAKAVERAAWEKMLSSWKIKEKNKIVMQWNHQRRECYKKRKKE